jgi:hypothetical protein
MQVQRGGEERARTDLEEAHIADALAEGVLRLLPHPRDKGHTHHT